MKIRLLLFAGFLSGIINFSVAQQNKGIYPMKSGHIEYALSGDLSGTKTVWFDDYGALYYERENSVLHMLYEEEESIENSNRLQIHTYEYTWAIDMTDKTGKRYDSYFSEDLYDDFDLTDDKAVKEELENTISDYGGEYLGMEELLGKNCHVYTVWGAKTWLYQGHTLKMITEFEGLKTEITATVYEENIEVPKEIFEVPNDIDIEIIEDIVVEDNNDAPDTYKELTWSFSEFQVKINKIKLKAFTVSDIFDLMGMYSATFNSGEARSIYIIANHIDNFDIDVDIEFDNSEKFEKYGCAMIYTPEIPNDSSNTSLLVMKYPKNNCYFFIYSYPTMSSKQMLKIAKQLK